MKANLQFTLPEEQDEFNLAIKAGKLYSALFRIRQEIFRPARKHGYSDERLQKLEADVIKSADLIGGLEDLFNEILLDEELSEFDI
jgi:hypothetical protein